MDGGRLYQRMEREVEEALAGSPREVSFTIGARWYARPGRAVAAAAELFRRRGYRLVRIVAGPGVWFATFEAIDPGH